MQDKYTSTSITLCDHKAYSMEYIGNGKYFEGKITASNPIYFTVDFTGDTYQFKSQPEVIKELEAEIIRIIKT